MSKAGPDGGADVLTPVADGVRVSVRLTPKASRSALSGTVATADGGRALKATVTAVPENGKANAALIALLSKAWKLPKGAFTITAGATDRRKTIHVAGPPADLVALLRGKIAP